MPKETKVITVEATNYTGDDIEQYRLGTAYERGKIEDKDTAQRIATINLRKDPNYYWKVLGLMPLVIKKDFSGFDDPNAIQPPPAAPPTPLVTTTRSELAVGPEVSNLEAEIIKAVSDDDEEDDEYGISDIPDFVASNYFAKAVSSIPLEEYLATPDPATADDAEPGVGIEQYDVLTGDSVTPLGAFGNNIPPDSNSAARNVEDGYESQGALVDQEIEKACEEIMKGGPGSGPQGGQGHKEDHKKEWAKHRDLAVKNGNAAKTLHGMGLHEAANKVQEIANNHGDQADYHSRMIAEEVGPVGKADSKKKPEERPERATPEEEKELRDHPQYSKDAYRTMTKKGKSNQEIKDAWDQQQEAQDAAEQETVAKGGPGSGPQGGRASIGQAQLHPITLTDEKGKETKIGGGKVDISSVHQTPQGKVYVGTQDNKPGVPQIYHESMVHSFHPAVSKAERTQAVDKFMGSEHLCEIKKADNEKQVAYCVVLEPNSVDSQNDWMTAEDIEDAAHSYIMKSRVIGSQHMKTIKAEPVESYIAPHDMYWDEGENGSQIVKKGSWVLGIKVHDAGEWEKVKSGEYSGVSVGGFGTRS